MATLIIDSGALLAMLDRRDTHHTTATTFIREHPTNSYLIPDLIFAETMTLVKARLGSQPAITLGQRLMQSNRFTLLPCTDSDRQEMWAIFSRYGDKDWSYADCSVLATARRADACLRLSDAVGGEMAHLFCPPLNPPGGEGPR